MRKIIIFISLLLSLNATSQGGRLVFWAGNKSIPGVPASGFQWATLATQSPTSYNNAGTLIIDGKKFTNLSTGVNDGDLLHFTGSGNIIIRNSYFGAAARNAITIGDGFTGTIFIENCLFASQKMGIEVSSSNCTVQILNCEFVNPWGAPVCKGQAFQAVGSTMTNSYIRNCRMENFRGLGNTEDWISFFNSGGTAGSRFIVEGNQVRGGGPGKSGGGFMLGDHGGSYVTVQNNKFDNPGNYQVAVSGGYNFIVQNNLAYSDIMSYSRIGMYAYGQEGALCGSITFQNNAIYIPNGNSWYAGDGSPAESCGTIIGANPWFNQTNSTSLTRAQLNFPTQLITLVSREILYTVVNEEAMQFRNVDGSCVDNVDVFILNTVPIPTPSAGSNQTIGGTSTTLNASGSTSSNGLNFQWEQVDGPVNTTIVNPSSVTTSITGLSVPGVYKYMVIVRSNDGAARGKTVLITKT